MVHTAQSIEEIKYFFKKFNEDKILEISLNSITERSKDLFSKVLLFQNDKEKVLIHFNNVEEPFKKRKDFRAIFLVYHNSSTGNFDFKRFVNRNNSIREVAEFLEGKSNKVFSDYVSCEIYSHLNTLEKNYKEKLLAFSHQELYDYLENNETDIDLIKNLFENDKKAISSLLVRELLESEKFKEVVSENLYNKQMSDLFEKAGINSLEKIDYEHLVTRFLSHLKNLNMVSIVFPKILKFSNQLSSETLKNIVEEVNDVRIQKEFEKYEQMKYKHFKRDVKLNN